MNRKSWIKSEVAFTQWVFNLNDNYSSALNPADFYHFEARGMNISFGYGKTLNKKVDFSIDLIYNNISFESGHNSEIAYPLDTEQDLSNSFALLMATPLGFINSEVQINRVDPNITNQETTFGLGLVNDHKIESIGVEPSFNFNLLKTKAFSFGPSLGMGLYYLSKIDNQLAEVNSQHAAFESTEFRITEDQQNINRFFTTLNFGAQIERSIYSKMKIGMNLNYKLPIQSSFNDQMGFSSSITQSDIGIYLKWLL